MLCPTKINSFTAINYNNVDIINKMRNMWNRIKESPWYYFSAFI